MDDMQNVIRDFLVESQEGLDQLDRDFLALEQNRDDADRLKSAFRAIHTIKGTCGFLSFSKLESVAHTGESLLALLRDGRLKLNQEITTALLNMVDAVRQILAAVESEGCEGGVDYSDLIATLNRLQSPGAAPAPAALKETSSAEKKLGEILTELGRVEPEVVGAAIRQQEENDPRRLGEILVEQGAIDSHDVLDALRTQSESRPVVSESSIRVDVGLLDKLMNLVGELVLARNQILQFNATQQDSVFLGTTQRLNLITTELQEGVMKTRMQPIGNVWNRLPRVVRDLATSCGKQIRLEMEGKETELDKTIIEAIKDPLTHIVRNAADHGIEMPSVRQDRGKPAEGRLLLRAFHEGGQVNIEISDDGAGVDPERVKQKALQCGLITPEQSSRMSEREATNLVFLPGFSTAEQVTNVSGRGVGMDVVKTNIEKIGGTVDLQSKPGQGTTLRIKIPLTLAIIPALVVTTGGDRFAIPQVSLLELVRLEGEQARTGIERIHGAPVYRLRGKLLPLVYLSHALKTSSEGKERESVNIVVLKADERQFGLVVEGINDTEEIVVKPLGKQLKGLSTFAGATIMGDGRVALILDVMGIAQHSNVISEGRDRALAEAAVDKGTHDADRQSLLLLGLGKGQRLAVPLSQVARLEEFDRAKVEREGLQEVVQYRNQIMPLVRLEPILYPGSDPVEMEETLQVVVYADGGRSVGLIVQKVLDIVSESTTVQRKSNRRPGILGSAVVQSRVTELLDVEAVIATAGV